MKALGLLLSLAALTDFAQQPETPLFRVVDVNQGELTDIALPNGTTARVQLLERSEMADTVRGAVRLARVRVTVNGKEVWLDCGNFAAEHQAVQHGIWNGHFRIAVRTDGRKAGILI